jgi:phosphoserine phosphatase
MLTLTARWLVVLWFVYLPFFTVADNSLASWNEGGAKQSILTFVAQVIDPGHASYVPADQRIATFDNDGTLWLEKPVFVQTVFTQIRAAQMMRENPKLGEAKAFRAFAEKDPNYRANLSKEELMELVLATHSGMTEHDFQMMVDKFLAEAVHPRFEQPYTKLAYQPMLGLINYLKANGFRVYLCTGGSTEFVRVLANKVYGIPPEQVIGTSMQTEFTLVDGKPGFMRLNKFVFPLNVRENKPTYIQRVLGRPPIIAVGNSDADIDMLKYAKGQPAGLAILLHHDDAVREYAYDDGAEEALKAAKEEKWVVVSMKNDFKEMFSFPDIKRLCNNKLDDSVAPKARN